MVSRTHNEAHTGLEPHSVQDDPRPSLASLSPELTHIDIYLSLLKIKGTENDFSTKT